MAGKWRSIAGLWGLAFVGSAALALAGRRWPEPLVPLALPVWLLLVLPPLVSLAWLLRGWSLPAAAGAGLDGAEQPAAGATAEEGQSDAIQQEQR